MAEDTKEDQTITLYFSEKAADMKSEQSMDGTIGHRFSVAAVPDENGGIREVDFTASMNGAPDEADKSYLWKDKQVVWSGPRSEMSWLRHGH